MEYTIVKQERKTATISISNQLEVIVKVPTYLSKRQIEELIARNEAWIVETLQHKKQLIETKDWFYSGEILYHGQYWKVERKCMPYKKASIDFTNKGFIIVSDGSESLERQLVEKFFRVQAKEQLTKMAELYAMKLGVTFQKITIRNQATRWGSCSSKGNLSFNLRILCAPPEMMAYVVLHEVMHLKHFNHSKAFWKNIEEVMPDYRDRMNYFRQFGQNFII